MITVRFPSGFSVQYNSAATVQTGEGFQRLKDANEVLIARVPMDCIVEWSQPCRTYQAAGNPDADRLAELEKQVRGLRRQIKELGKK